MSYTPTNWQTGDIITAEKLNKLEVGVATTSNLFAELSPIFVDETEYTNVVVSVNGVPGSYVGFTTDSDITKIVGTYYETGGYFGYTLFYGYQIGTVTGISASDVGSSKATIIGESVALIPEGSDKPFLFPSSTQFVKGTKK